MDAPPLQFTRTKDGFDIAYATCGSGIPFVMAPVVVNDIQRLWHVPTMSAIYTELAARFSLIQYDSRGQGSSSRDLPNDLSLGDYESDMEAVIAATGAQRFVLYGPSGFSQVAVRYAIKHPKRVIALILWHYEDYAVSPPATATRDLAAQDWSFFLDVVARTGFPTSDPVSFKADD